MRYQTRALFRGYRNAEVRCNFNGLKNLVLLIPFFFLLYFTVLTISNAPAQIIKTTAPAK